ncbi:MAG: peroxiredoxin [Candidatus Thioglobus sp.]|jgi:peroxiredoxin Q/BCP|nr:peroxiredoxin [Candidatus Thioglobus sp.]MBT5165055.1 peroxiredoxin [Candidatus Thioglobus sp.]MBT6279144.1 peroxiredoxin [Candidatus Thioglobus sp.]MBT7840007.1 peroxiredoxin [Candidatus Thioglobus sp.]
MNKVQSITCHATSNLDVSIPDPQGRNIVLYFYPKDSTPGCTTEGQDFRDNHQAFVDANTVIYGVSRDKMKSHENFKAKQDFPFELISDPEEILCNAFNVIQLKKLYGKEYMGIVRSTFLIDGEGNILEHWDKVKVKGHVEEVLQKVNTL